MGAHYPEIKSKQDHIELVIQSEEEQFGKTLDTGLEIFYSALYHTMIHPDVHQDVNGEYRGIDKEVHKAEGFTNHTVFSLWDTFRALHPLVRNSAGGPASRTRHALRSRYRA